MLPASFSRKLLTVIAGLLLLAGCAELDNEEGQGAILLPDFSVVDTGGHLIRDDSFRKDKVVIFFPCGEPGLDKKLIGWISEYEQREEFKFSKICIAPGSELTPKGWICVRDVGLKKKFGERFRNRSILLFNEGVFFSSLSRHTGKVELMVRLHVLAGEFESFEDYRMTNWPPDYIDTGRLFSEVSAAAGPDQSVVVLIINTSIQDCGDMNIYQYFDSVVANNLNCFGIIILDDSFGETDDYLISNNMGLRVPVIKASPALLADLNALKDKNFGASSNFCFAFYNGGNLLEAFYIRSDCTPLKDFLWRM